jgi:acyl-CoA thioesterase FadM
MSLRGDFSRVVQMVELLMAEVRILRMAGPSFRIVHRFWLPDTGRCTAREEIFAVYLIHRGREYAWATTRACSHAKSSRCL